MHRPLVALCGPILQHHPWAAAERLATIPLGKSDKIPREDRKKDIINPKNINIMVQVIEVIKQLEIVIPTMMAAELLLTSTIKGIFDITSDAANTILSWIISLATAFLFVYCNGLTFGLGGWDYAVAAVGGLIVAICTNKIYTWEKVKAVLDAITNLFGGTKVY